MTHQAPFCLDGTLCTHPSTKGNNPYNICPISPINCGIDDVISCRNSAEVLSNATTASIHSATMRVPKATNPMIALSICFCEICCFCITHAVAFHEMVRTMGVSSRTATSSPTRGTTMVTRRAPRMNAMANTMAKYVIPATTGDELAFFILFRFTLSTVFFKPLLWP